MAEPAWTSLDSPPATVEGAVVTVGDQNWQQGGSPQPLTEPRFVKRWALDGGSWSVPAPPKVQDLTKTPPDPDPPGTVPAELTRFDFSGLIPLGDTRVVTFQVFAGTHSRYVREDGSVAYDAIEWGGGRVVTGEPLYFSLLVTNAFTRPPSPLPSELQEMVDNVDAERALAKAKDPEAWLRDNAGEASELLRFLIYLTFGKDYPVPNLATHIGRAASGRLQESAIAHRLG